MKGKAYRIFWLILFMSMGLFLSVGLVSAAKFNIGDGVRVTANLNVRTGPGTGYPERCGFNRGWFNQYI